MPIYDYTCDAGHLTEVLRRVEDRHDPVACGECGSVAELKIGAPHFGVLKMGVDPGFPSFYDKWARIQRSKNSGKSKDANNKYASDKTLADAGLL